MHIEESHENHALPTQCFIRRRLELPQVYESAVAYLLIQRLIRLGRRGSPLSTKEDISCPFVIQLEYHARVGLTSTLQLHDAAKLDALSRVIHRPQRLDCLPL